MTRPPSLDEATSSVDALVADSIFDEFTGFEHASRSSTHQSLLVCFLHAQPRLYQEKNPLESYHHELSQPYPFTHRELVRFFLEPLHRFPMSRLCITILHAPSYTSETPTSQAKQDVQQLASSSGLRRQLLHSFPSCSAI